MIISHQELDSMHKNLDIQALNRKKAELELNFNQHKELVRTAILDWISNDVKEIINNTVINEHANTISLGETKLLELKSKSNEIPDKARSMINEFLNKDSVWQLEDNNGIVFSNIHPRPTASLDRAIRYAKGLAGALLIEYDYSPDSWEISQGDVCSKYGYDWDKSINSKMNELHTIIWLLNDINKRIEDAIFNEQKAKAKQLWDKA